MSTTLFWACPADRLPHRRLLAMHLALRERIHIRAASVAAGVLPADISRIDPVRGSCSISFWYNSVKIMPPYPRDYQVTDATWRSCRPHAAKLAGRLTFNWLRSTIIICHAAISGHVVFPAQLAAHNSAESSSMLYLAKVVRMSCYQVPHRISK